jgi:uncharacterized protein (TIGR03067 family)
MIRLLSLAIVLCAGCGKSPPRTDAEQIIGEWVVVDFQSPKHTEDRSQRRKLALISAESWSEQFQGDLFEDFEYRLDPTTNPKSLDLIYTDSRGNRLTVRAIYEMRDRERLRVCLGSPPVITGANGKLEYVESVRPTAFAPTTGPLISYRRKTP